MPRIDASRGEPRNFRARRVARGGMECWKIAGTLFDAGRPRNFQMRIGIALGSNLGDRLANLRAARKGIVDLAADKTSVLTSRFYETEPIDCELGAAKFLNAVMEMEYDGDQT